MARVRGGRDRHLTSVPMAISQTVPELEQYGGVFKEEFQCLLVELADRSIAEVILVRHIVE